MKPNNVRDRYKIYIYIWLTQTKSHSQITDMLLHKYCSLIPLQKTTKAWLNYKHSKRIIYLSCDNKQLTDLQLMLKLQQTRLIILLLGEIFFSGRENLNDNSILNQWIPQRIHTNLIWINLPDVCHSCFAVEMHSLWMLFVDRPYIYSCWRRVQSNIQFASTFRLSGNSFKVFILDIPLESLAHHSFKSKTSKIEREKISK